MTRDTSGLRRVALIGGVRLPFMRIGTDLASESLLDMLVSTVEALVKKYHLEKQIIGEVALGTTFYHPNFWNLSRDVVFKTSLSHLSPAMGAQRACATSLETTISVANKIALGQIESGIAGGAESLSNTALYLRPEFAQRIVKNSKARNLLQKLSVWKGIHLKDFLPSSVPAVEMSSGKSMGQHCEMMAQHWRINRLEQDTLALASHQNGMSAYMSGFYDDLVLNFKTFSRDNNLRADTSLEKLAKLKPAFEDSIGTLTAGNSSPLTDGAGAVLLSSEEWAKEHGLPVIAYIRDFETAAVDIQHEGLLMAPVYAMPKMLKRNNLELQDFDFYEIHEAFAAQVLCNLKAWESKDFCRNQLGLSQPLGAILREKLNVVGGSVALGHPFGATGSRLIATMGKLLNNKGGGRGVISVCTGGGMGTVMILEKS